MSKEQRQSLKLLEPRSFDVYKNIVAPVIAILGCLELDMEVSDAGMETVETDDCKGMSRKDGDVRIAEGGLNFYFSFSFLFYFLFHFRSIFYF